MVAYQATRAQGCPQPVRSPSGAGPDPGAVIIGWIPGRTALPEATCGQEDRSRPARCQTLPGPDRRPSALVREDLSWPLSASCS